MVLSNEVEMIRSVASPGIVHGTSHRATFTNGWYSQAIFSQDERHRYMLGRTWGVGPHLVVIGLNPSTATENINDPTIRRCIDYATRWGYAGLIMLNLFSFRATDPAHLYAEIGLKRYSSDEHTAERIEAVTGGDTHAQYLRWYCDRARAGLVVAAWGNHGGLLKRGRQVAIDVTQQRGEIYALGVTKEGHPVHPLYQRRDVQLKPYVVVV